MYLRKLRGTDIERVKELGNTNVDLSFLEKNRENNRSIGVFEDHRLVAYAIVYKEGSDFVLRDFYSEKVKHYIYLFGYYFKEPLDSYNYVPYNKMRFELPKDKSGILKWYFSKVTSEVIESIEENENGFFGDYTVKTPIKYKYRRLNVLHVLYSNTSLNRNYFQIFDDLAKIMPLKEIEAVQGRVFKEAYKRNMGFLEQMHPEVLTISHSSKSLYNGENEQFSKRLTAIGFKKRGLAANAIDKAYQRKIPISDFDGRFRRDNNKLEIFKALYFKGFREYDDSLALYRFYIKKAINHLKQNQLANRYLIVDREGYVLVQLSEGSNPVDSVPYMYKSIFLSKIKTAKLVEEIQEHVARILGFNIEDVETSWGFRATKLVTSLKRVIGGKETIDFFIRLASEFKGQSKKKGNHHTFSSWTENRITNYEFLFKHASLLTRGTVLKFLNKDYKSYCMFMRDLDDLVYSIKVSEIKFARKRLKKANFQDYLSYNEAILDILRNELKVHEMPYQDKVEELIVKYFIPTPNPEKEGEFTYKKSFMKMLYGLNKHVTTETQFNLFTAAIEAYEKINRYIEWDSLYPMGNLNEVEEIYSYEAALKTLDLFIRTKTSESRETILDHDIGYAIQILCKNKSIKKKEVINEEMFLYIIENYSLNKINTLNSELVVLLSYKDLIQLYSKTFIKQVQERILNKESLTPLIEEMDSKAGKYLLKKYDKEKELNFENVVDFVNRMRRYLDNASISLLFNTFKSEAVKMINGEKEGLFEPQEYLLPNSYLVKQLKVELKDGGKNATGTNPRRLYHHLSKIRPVNELMNGEATLEQIKEVFNAFKIFKIKEDRRILDASLLKGMIEPKCSPEFLVAGDASVCCMSFGAENAYDYAMEKGFGLFNVYYKDRIIANSVIWINEIDNHLVIDNIEVHPNYYFMNSLLKKLYIVMIKDTVKKYNLDGAVQGVSYNDLNLGKGSVLYYKFKARDVEDSFYTDAHDVRTIKL